MLVFVEFFSKMKYRLQLCLEETRWSHSNNSNKLTKAAKGPAVFLWAFGLAANSRGKSVGLYFILEGFYTCPENPVKRINKKPVLTS